jgi:hypothetical protein
VPNCPGFSFDGTLETCRHILSEQTLSEHRRDFALTEHLVSKKSRRSLTLPLLIFLLAVLAALGIWRRQAPSPRLSHALSQRERLDGGVALSSTPVERRQQIRELRRTLDRLTPDERRVFWADRRQSFHAWLVDFFHAGREERSAVVKEEIRRMKDFRDRISRESATRRDSLWTEGLSEAELEQSQEIWLDLMTPEERSLVDAYFDLLNQQSSGCASSFSPWGEAPT